MSLCEGEKTRFGVGFGLSEVFDVKLGMQQGSALSTFLAAAEVHVIINVKREIWCVKWATVC